MTIKSSEWRTFRCFVFNLASIFCDLKSHGLNGIPLFAYVQTACLLTEGNDKGFKKLCRQ